MTDLDLIRAIKESAQGRLLAIPGVHAVGIGSKIVDGQRTSETAIMVFVEKKKPMAELRPEEVIPSEIEGVKTDVYESEIPRIHAQDTERYRPLIGGSQIMPGGLAGAIITPAPPGPPRITPAQGLGLIGTLGCIAKIGGADPKIVALTCQHVVAISPSAKPTNLIATTVMPKITFSGANTPGSLVLARLGVTGSPLQLQAFYATSGSDNLNTIASAVAAKINLLATPGISATGAGPEVSVTGPLSSLRCKIYGAHADNTWADVHTSVAGSVISVTGQASKRCAAYVSLNLGGSKPTFGMFVHIDSGASATTVATAIATAISKRNLPGVIVLEIDPPSPGQAAIVSLTGVQEIQCDVSNDVRVGQPTNTFCSKCSKCCGDLIGVLIDARLDLDIALIQLAPAFVDKYRAEIKDIGVVRGVHDVTKEASGYPLKVRGALTGQVQHGTLLAVDVDGDAVFQDTDNTPPTWTLHHRFYKGAFSISGAAFSISGDSGAAVLTDSAPNSNSEVVGILFGGSSTLSVATPIQQIIAAFPDLSIETAVTLGDDKGVPTLTAHATAVDIQNAAVSADELPGPVLQQLQQVEQEITATPAGRRYADLVQRHFSEAQTLVNTNRRVATAWHRNGGPRIASAVLRIAESPDEPLPAEING
ncbi:MAG: hypothetical protein M3R52_05125, partial [Acidobacteriota bacterium]|nr:hypothetical protein [Acidobacteriota bacterium]